jgi:large subunit ribosomal protein L6
MSRIGKLPITIPEGVDISVTDTNRVKVKGKLGELEQLVDPAIKLNIEDGTLSLERATESKDHKSKHGLYRALINNMVQGVSEGFEIQMEIVGVGYRVEVKGQVIDLSLGYSHHIYMELPEEVQVEAITERGKSPLLKLKSYDKQLIGQVAAKIRSLRPPEPYKGKGIKFKGEVLRKKAGKSAIQK